ncbi:MAG: hypothetical protein PHD04_01230 [Candidatus Pacebacteria bacterium]|nr:hypothetical protein [Candidatus Paceibacterota bacterium]
MNSFIVGIMLGVLLAGAWFVGGGEASLLPRLSSLSFATSTESVIQKSGAVSVTDQSPGDSVVVESVTVPPPGIWIAVREVTGADLGNVLGAVRVGGPRSNLSIPLLRATEAGRPYAVQLYRDDGTGDFNPAMNSVYVDFDTGARVVAYFKTTD